MHPQLWDTPAAESLRFQQVVALAADSWQNSERRQPGRSVIGGFLSSAVWFMTMLFNMV